MNCNCKKKPRFVRGNAFSLNVKVKAKRPDGTPVSDFVLDDTATLLLMTSNGVATVLTYTVGDDNNAIVAFDGNLPTGIYGLDFQGSQDGTEWRFSDTNIFQVVEHTPQGHVPSDGVVYADDTLEVNAEITLSTLSAQADWTETDPGAQSYIRNKPDLSDYATDQELAAGLANKVDKVAGKGLSTNDFTTALKNKLSDMANIKEISSTELDGMITDADEGFYVVSADGGPLLVEVYKDGSTVYQWAVEPHSGHILVRTYNTQAVSPAWSEFADAYANKQDTLTFDSTPTANSTNPVTSGGIKTYVDNHSSQIDVDDELSATSENPVQNKVVTTALNGKQPTLTFDNAPTESSNNPVKSGGVYTALQGKQDTLTFDNAPTANSNNPVKSGGVKTALDAKQDTISTVNVTVDDNTGTPSGSASVSGSTLSLSFQNLKGATGAQGPQGIQGVQGVQGPKGDTGVTGDASSLTIIHGIDKTSSYGTTDVCGADAAQALLNEIEGGFYY